MKKNDFVMRCLIIDGGIFFSRGFGKPVVLISGYMELKSSSLLSCLNGVCRGDLAVDVAVFFVAGKEGADIVYRNTLRADAHADMTGAG